MELFWEEGEQKEPISSRKQTEEIEKQEHRTKPSIASGGRKEPYSP